MNVKITQNKQLENKGNVLTLELLHRASCADSLYRLAQADCYSIFLLPIGVATHQKSKQLL